MEVDQPFLLSSTDVGEMLSELLNKDMTSKQDLLNSRLSDFQSTPEQTWSRTVNCKLLQSTLFSQLGLSQTKWFIDSNLQDLRQTIEDKASVLHIRLYKDDNNAKNGRPVMAYYVKWCQEERPSLGTNKTGEPIYNYALDHPRVMRDAVEYFIKCKVDARTEFQKSTAEGTAHNAYRHAVQFFTFISVWQGFDR
jgi:hypothetical protein